MTIQSPFLPNTRFFPEDLGLLQRELNLTYNDVANTINIREIGIYSTKETVTGQRFFSDVDSNKTRATSRKVIKVPSILNGTTQIPHNIKIVSSTVFTSISGVGNNTNIRFIPIPYINVGALADSVQLSVTPTNVELITTTANYTAFSAYIILEYIPS